MPLYLQENFTVRLLELLKQGDIDGFPIYKIGPMYYIDAKTGEEQQNKLV
jgi:hypothetical protein